MILIKREFFTLGKNSAVKTQVDPGFMFLFILTFLGLSRLGGGSLVLHLLIES